MLAAVATSCGAVAQRAKHVTINESAIDKFLDSLSPETLSSDYAIMAIPLKFPRIEEEINFVCVLDLLNFGSGYRKELHLAGDRGAFETMLFGTMSMYLHHGSLSASVLTKLTLGDVAEEKATHLPGVYTNAPTKLTPLAKAIVSTMNETGATLLKLGYADFASFVIDTLSKAPDHRADRLVERLMSSFPAFDDRAKHTGEEVIIAKKAQLLASDLSRRLKDRKPEFSYGDNAAFTVFADNVLPCMLRHLGILELTPALAARIDAGELLPPGEEETELRAVSVAACARVVQRAATMDKFRNAPVTAPKLDYYLWKEAKAGTNRALHRHATQDTVYY